MGFLDVEGLTTHFSAGGRFLDRLVGRETGLVTAVDGVTLSVERGEIFGVVGESGSGKTTLGRSVLRLVRASAGRVVVDGTDVLALSDRQFRPWRRRMQMVFQDPNAALNPAMTVGRAVAHPLRIHGLAEGADLRRRTLDMLERVGLQPATRYHDAYPSDLSGGQKQRVVIARALVTRPEIVVADEPVSMLDMSVRAKILGLLLELQRDLELT
ncbi:MAG TPA: dipeptide/oligopeptide/nickel ABC transporter ATP-binding protein, partial [Acidimicrobiales bacterium]|nr:dipeptide/oligopeptide/nickel ABC transporter ATP-binding protein [Acidimicrobiales bacterium]